MPMYDFQCPKCKNICTDILCKHADVVRCSEDDEQMNRMPSAPAFAVKGFSAGNGYSGFGQHRQDVKIEGQPNMRCYVESH